MASLSQTGSTTSSVTITCSGLDSSHSRTRYFWWQLYENGSVVSEHGSTMAPGGTTHSTSFTGLDPGTTYGVLCGIYDDSAHSDLLALLSGSATTDAPTPTTITASIYNIYGQGTPQQVTTRTLSVGSQYTPSWYVPTHTAGYDLTQIYTTAGGWTDVTSGSFTVPAYDISIYYYFETTPTSCNVVIYYDGVSQGVAETRQYTKGATIHPRSNQPSYDSTNYELESIWCYKSEDGSYTDVTTGYVTVPYSGYMTLDYMYVSKSKVFIFDGSQWRRATPYIFDGSQWVQAKGYIYDGSGWQP